VAQVGGRSQFQSAVPSTANRVANLDLKFAAARQNAGADVAYAPSGDLKFRDGASTVAEAAAEAQAQAHGGYAGPPLPGRRRSRGPERFVLNFRHRQNLEQLATVRGRGRTCSYSLLTHSPRLASQGQPIELLVGSELRAAGAESAKRGGKVDGRGPWLPAEPCEFVALPKERSNNRLALEKGFQRGTVHRRKARARAAVHEVRGLQARGRDGAPVPGDASTASGYDSGWN